MCFVVAVNMEPGIMTYLNSKHNPLQQYKIAAAAQKNNQDIYAIWIVILPDLRVVKTTGTVSAFTFLH
jgi:hypothetical protein